MTPGQVELWPTVLLHILLHLWDTPQIRFKQSISNMSNRLFSYIFILHVSDPYMTVGNTTPSYIVRFTFFSRLLTFHILSIAPNTFLPLYTFCLISVSTGCQNRLFYICLLIFYIWNCIHCHLARGDFFLVSDSEPALYVFGEAGH